MEILLSTGYYSMNLLEYFQPQIRKYPPRQFSGVHWLGLYPFTADGPGLSPGWETKIP